jgi:hypothetical protein
MALIFVHDQLHEGAAVVSGRKYVLRTDVMYTIGVCIGNNTWVPLGHPLAGGGG